MSRPRNTSGYIIRISEQAPVHMCLSGMEAFSASHLRRGPRIRLETYGSLWGHEVRLPRGRTLYSVEMAAVDTSAKMENDEVRPAPAALDLKRDVMTSFWPQLEFLGDFHTHPERKAADVVREGL